MKKKLVTVLVIIAVVLALGIAGALGFVWYRDNHVFIEGDAYPLDSQQIDLTGKEISVAYYEELQEKLPDCNIRWMVPFHGGKYPSDTESLTISELTVEDVELIARYFTNLKTIDAMQCHDYEALEVAAATLTQCELNYHVNLGHPGHYVHYQVETAQLTFVELTAGEPDFDFDTLMKNLAHMPRLKQLTLKKVPYSHEQIESLKAAYPEIEFLCTVEILGQEYDMETTELDLSGMTGEDAVAVVDQLKLLPNLTYVNLNPENGIGALSKEDVKKLLAAVPGVTFDFSFDFFGETLTTASEEVKLTNVRIGDENETEVRLALDLLGNCKRFVLDNCHMSDEVLAKIRDDYRDRTKVVWRVWFGGGSSLTDAEVIRCTYDLVDDNCADLYWCEDVRFVDFGHNEWLDGCDFIAGMKSLEYCILSGAPIKSLEPFANCKNLKFLEVAFCEYIESVEPLKNCTKLEKLNISNTHVVDLAPLDNLPLTHFVAMEINAGKSRVSEEEQARFISLHPKCWSSFEGKQPYDDGWRRDTDRKTPLPHYATIQIAFRYPHAPNNVGWYLKEEERTAMEALLPAAEVPVIEETVPAETAAEETVPAETVTE